MLTKKNITERRRDSAFGYYRNDDVNSLEIIYTKKPQMKESFEDV